MDTSVEQTTPLSPTKRALIALQEMQAKLDAIERAQTEPIAIVGMGCRFPGAPNLAAFWQMLCEGRSGITDVPSERWHIDELYSPEADMPAKIRSRKGGFVDTIKQFDARFFGISSREAPHIDPRQRLVLEVAWEALEDAGIAPERLARTPTGVMVATLTADYDTMISRDFTNIQAYTGPGTANSVVANRLSYFLDLRGPSLAVDTACSGSLVALHLACRSLRSGESTLVLAGGVSVNLLPNGDLFFTQAGALSPDGKCQTFDAQANGIVRSEGVGILVLKTLSRALADADRIYALIGGSAVNHDGRSNGIMAPNVHAQAAVYRQAYAQAGVEPAQVQFVETHGTGTPLGDPIEVQSVAEVLRVDRPSTFACVLGSVKTNIGHTEAAAGVAGVIKTALALKHHLLPPNLHFAELNPLIPLPHFPLKIASRLGPWPDTSVPLIAGVSSFGFGGTNAHVVLKEAPPEAERLPASPALQCIPLSARSPVALQALAQRYEQWLQQSAAAFDLRDMAYTTSLRRSHHDHRLALVVQDRSELIAGLQAAATGAPHPGIVAAPPASAPDSLKRLVFVFSGQGSHWFGMGRELLQHSPVFRQALEACDRLLQPYVSWSLRDVLSAEATASRLDQTDVAQPAIFALQVALAALWRSWGIVPDAIVGQSLGEVAAAHVAGALSLADAVQVVFHRSRLMKTTAGQGQVAVIGLSQAQAQVALAAYEPDLVVAGSSSPTACVIAGTAAAMGTFLRELECQEVFNRLLDNVDIAFHSPQMLPLYDDLVQALQGIRPRSTSIPFISTVTGMPLAGRALDAAYWGRNLTQPFQFTEALQQLITDGHHAFVEISPHTVLSGAIRQGLAHLDRQGVVLAARMRDESEWHAMLRSLGAVYTHGYTVDWRALHPDHGRCLSLPTYPWQRESFWLEDISKNEVASAIARVRKTKSGRHPLLGERLQSAVASGSLFWEIDLGTHALHALTDHRVLGAVMFPGAAYMELALAATTQAFQDRFPVLVNLTFDRALRFAVSEIRRVQLALTPTATGEASFQIHSRLLDTPEATNSWTLHATGTVRYRAGNIEPVYAASVSLPQLQAQCSESVHVAEHYEVMTSRGLAYGPAFQALSELWRGAGEALGRVVLPSAVMAEAALYEVHPVVIDTGFQVVGATLLTSDNDYNRDVYLPQGVECLQVYGPASSPLWCHARLRPGFAPGVAAIQADIVLFNDTGRVLIDISGLRLQRLEAVPQSRQREPRDWLYEVAWQPQEVERDTAPPARLQSGGWLIFADHGGIGQALATQLTAEGAPCVLVYPGETYHIAPDARAYWLVPDRSAHYHRLFHNTLLKEDGAFCGIVHLWGLDGAGSDALDQQGLDHMQALGCESALHIVRALTEMSLESAPRLWLVTQRAQPVGEGVAPVSVAQAALWGFGRVLSLELKEFWGGLIDVDAGNPTSAAALLVAELRQPSAEDQIAFRSGQRYVARLCHLPQAEQPLPMVHFRVDGTYLITGGLSGLGLVVARWMLRRGARRLLLVGRTELPARSHWGEMTSDHPAAARIAAIRDLEALGAHVQVASIDIADAATLSALLTQFSREGWPPIRGVVHAAGLIQDQLLMQMELETFRTVLRPKVHGAWALHRATQDLALDFFVLFSSITAILGQFGQANYAAGNAFMDALAHYRRAQGLPACSINWGPWSGVGMFARLQTSGQDTALGIDTIAPEQGLQVLEYLLARHTVQVSVAGADWRRFPRSPLLSTLSSPEAVAGASAPEPGDTTALLELLLTDISERKSLLESKLCEVTAQVFREEPDQIDVSKPLISLGMDSLMAVELKNRVERTFNLQVSMVDLFTGSISRLAEHLMSQLQADDGLADLFTQVEDLSMDEVNKLLDQGDV